MKFKGWYRYFKPVLLNSITRTETDPKIYRWLFWIWEE